MKTRLLAKLLEYSRIGLLALIFLPSLALAQAEHAHGLPSQNQEQTVDRSTRANALVQIVRQATERFRDVGVAEAEEYKLLFGCVSGSDWGAMGLHYVNMALVLDGELDPTRPEIILYEALPNGRLKLTGADYLVLADGWEAKHPVTTPELMGQLLHYFESPNRFGLPPFYTLHVWAWKENPNGAFVNWHSKISCDGFNPQN